MLQSSSNSFSRSRHNLSLTFSRFIGVELHSEESSVAFSWSIGVELDSEGFIMSTFHWTLKICILKSSYPFVEFKFTVYGLTYILDMYTCCNAVTLVWGSLRLIPIKLWGYMPICVSLYFLMYIALNGINSIGLKLGMMEPLHSLIYECSRTSKHWSKSILGPTWQCNNYCVYVWW